MNELFPSSEEILIAGCSAGGSGAIGASAIVRLQFPDARLFVLDRSGLRLVDPKRPEIYEMLKETWNIGQFIPPDSLRCNEQFIYIDSRLLDRNPVLKIGLFSSYQDAGARSV